MICFFFGYFDTLKIFEYSLKLKISEKLLVGIDCSLHCLVLGYFPHLLTSPKVKATCSYAIKWQEILFEKNISNSGLSYVFQLSVGVIEPFLFLWNIYLIIHEFSNIWWAQGIQPKTNLSSAATLCFGHIHLSVIT